jgi:hypothetical protein
VNACGEVKAKAKAKTRIPARGKGCGVFRHKSLAFDPKPYDLTLGRANPHDCGVEARYRF